jgi:hypothetical protein
MPSDKFPNQDPKPELSLEELEKIIKLREDLMPPGLEQFTESGKWVKFVITSDYDLILSDQPHEVLVKMFGLDRNECLIPDGAFKLFKDTKKMTFGYGFAANDKKTQKVAESKILAHFKATKLFKNIKI